ncbi:FAD-binding oxidoreductase [Leifsonia sp. RAF41]|uniref:FAD-binding oxidoreductase n=1 Tax=Leifsonia sp. RAF41 TaxID=3233056 RepID=UPI003F9D67F1
MGIELDSTTVARLRDHVTGKVYLRGDEGLAAEITCFNPAIRHDPDIVVAVASEDDVVEAVSFARSAGLPVRVQATGHGAEAPIIGGMILSTKGLDGLSIDPETRMARIGAGVRWAPVIVAAAEHGLAPITGSSTSVGAVGYTLGGGIGPMARTYGFTSDWVRGFRVVTADGRIVTADEGTNRDLFWALRGGKGGLAVVTEMSLELVALRSLYGGSVFFEGGAIEPALRAWIDWSAELPDEATTSVAILTVPDIDGPPPPLRGRTVLSVRFAYPGETAEGERLFEPIRAAAPVYLDFVAEMPATAVASINNDPEEGGPTWIRGFMLDTFDQDAGDVILELGGPGSGAPFLSVEIRQIGGATARDTADGTAVGGRDSGYTLTLLAADPSTFAEAAPARAGAIADALRVRISAITNVNFAGDLADRAAFERVWPPAIEKRLEVARTHWDPDRVFAFGPS